MLDKKKATGLHPRPYLRNINVRWHRLDLDDLAVMDIDPKQSERYSVRAGDVLVCEGGEPGRASVVPVEADGLAYQKALHRVRVGPELDAAYLAYFLQYLAGSGQLDEHFTGSTIKHLPLERIAELSVALPSLEEQKRVTRRLHETSARLALVRRAVSSIDDNVTTFRRSVIEHAACGRLVDGYPQRPTRSRRRPSGRGGSQRFDLSQLPRLHEGWEWCAAADLCLSIESGQTPAQSAMSPDTGEVPFLKVYNLKRDGGLDFTIRPTYISYETHATRLKRSIALPGDVLINIVGPPMGKVAIVPNDHPEWNYNQAIVGFRPGLGLTSEFLALLLRSRFVLDRLVATAKATAGQFNLAVSACRELPLPVPPIDVQHELVAAAAPHLGFAEQTAETLDRIDGLCSSLSASLLARLFGTRQRISEVESR